MQEGVWHTGIVERAGRVVWLGSLVFFNLRGAGRKSVFGILWLLCVAKLAQRVTFTLVGKNSLAHGKNPRLIISYMARMLHNNHHEQQHGDGADGLLKNCRYAVMGEDKLVTGLAPTGCSLADDANGVTTTTVGKIWQLADSDPFLASIDQDRRLRRLCLSVALFKLLRRSFEHLPPMSEAETRDCRDLIFQGLYNNRSNGGQDDKAEELFQVMNDETIFLSEYYHSVVPVALASPFFLLVNYLVLPFIVLVLCLVMVVLCGNGDVLFAFRSMESDNYSISLGVARMAGCLLRRVATSPSVFFSTIDFSITLLLILVLVYEQAWELVVFLFSNWFLVSLLHGYAAKLHWRGSAVFSWAIRRILWVRGKMSHPDLTMKQLFALRSCRCRLSLMLPATVSQSLPILPTIAVPKEVKRSIAEYIATSLYDPDNIGGRGRALSNGKLAVAGHRELRRACENESVAEVILAWHVATCLFEERRPPCPKEEEGTASARVVATTLSKYCAYLVAYHPELLPDSQEYTESVFEAMEIELRSTVGFWSYYLPDIVGARHEKVRSLAEKLGEALELVGMTVLQRGASLGRALEEEDECGGEGMWKVLADLWVQLLVYVAPSGDEERVMGHAKVLPEGGEFVTVLWALATHTGMRRAPVALAPPVDVEMEHV